MTLEEANKTIAEYMGWSSYRHWKEYEHYRTQRPELSSYSKSLDALVPVWQKLGSPLDIAISVFSEGRGLVYVGEGLENKAHRETIQEAACIATARAIKHKNNGN